MKGGYFARMMGNEDGFRRGLQGTAELPAEAWVGAIERRTTSDSGSRRAVVVRGLVDQD